VQDGAGNGESLMHAAGKAPHRRVGTRREVRALGRFFDDRRDVGEPVQLGVEGKVFPYGEIWVKKAGVRDESNPAADFFG
jgi:hypothetical protein